MIVSVTVVFLRILRMQVPKEKVKGYKLKK
jgi:hypothetical protein